MIKKILKFCTKYDIVFHSVGCCALVLILALCFNVNIVLACWIALAVGIAKEWLDHFLGGYGTLKDYVADLIGTIVGAVIYLIVA